MDVDPRSQNVRTDFGISKENPSKSKENAGPLRFEELYFFAGIRHSSTIFQYTYASTQSPNQGPLCKMINSSSILIDPIHPRSTGHKPSENARNRQP